MTVGAPDDAPNVLHLVVQSHEALAEGIRHWHTAHEILIRELTGGPKFPTA